MGYNPNKTGWNYTDDSYFQNKPHNCRICKKTISGQLRYETRSNKQYNCQCRECSSHDPTWEKLDKIISNKKNNLKACIEVFRQHDANIYGDIIRSYIKKLRKIN